jgi:4-amino-4-deoxy-L-arabinose transferase-like glycosyltransferase
VLVALQLVALLVLAGVTTARFRVWADVDERPHYDYVQKLVEDRHIPRPTDLVSPEVQAISDRTWPRPSPTDRAAIGIPGRSYEAIQPPLTYVVAAPAFVAVGDHRDKVFALRIFDVLLLLATVGLLWRLARRIAEPEAALAGLSASLVVLLWPGVLVRAVTFGNTPLELLLTSAFLLALWRADAPGRARPMLAAALLLGLCLLTKLTLVLLVPVLLVVLVRRARAGASPALWAVLALPPLMLAPWLALNVERYGSPTVDIEGDPGVAGEVQTAGAFDRLVDLPRPAARLLDGVLPQEWLIQLDVWWVRLVVDGLAIGLLAAGLAGLVIARRAWGAWFLALPLASGLGMVVSAFLVTGADSFYLRYVYPALLPFALGAGIGLARRGVSRLHVGGLLAVTLILGGLWVDLAGFFWFNDIGRKLGI